LALLKKEQIIIFLRKGVWLLSIKKGVGRKCQGTSLLLLSRDSCSLYCLGLCVSKLNRLQGGQPRRSR